MPATYVRAAVETPDDVPDPAARNVAFLGQFPRGSLARARLIDARLVVELYEQRDLYPAGAGDHTGMIAPREQSGLAIAQIEIGQPVA